MPADLAAITLASFEPLIGARFRLHAPGGVVDVTLAEAREVGGGVPGGRQAFSLVFDAKDGARHPQQIYRIDHETLGELELFLVPIAVGRYEASFS